MQSYVTRYIKLLCIYFFLLSIGESLTAQPVFKEKTGNDGWLSSSVEIYLNNHSNFIIDGNLQRSSFAGDRLGNSPFDETNLLIGYQHFFKEKWQLRLTQSRNRIVTGRRDFSKLSLQHNGKIESLIFLKRFTTAYVQFRDDFNQDDDIRLSLFAYLGKRFQVNNRTMQLGVSYEAFRNWNAVGEPRRISSTSLALDYQLFITKNLILTAFARRDTDYFFAEEQFGLDDDGNFVLLKPFRRLNLFTPVYGIKLRFILAPHKAHSSLPFNLFSRKQE